MKSFGDIDSKFRFVILASKRAKELLTGAKPRIKSKSKNPIRIAQNEVAQGLIDFEIIQHKEEDKVIPEEEVFIGEEVKEEAKVKEEKRTAEEEKKIIEGKKAKKKTVKKKVEQKTGKKTAKGKKKKEE